MEIDEPQHQARRQRRAAYIEGDELLDVYPHLQFQDAPDRLSRYDSLRLMTPRANTVICWPFLDEVAETDLVRQFTGVDTPWTRCFSVPNAAHRELTLECLSTFRLRYHFLLVILPYTNINYC